MRLVRETGKPIAQVARDLGINEGTYPAFEQMSAELETRIGYWLAAVGVAPAPASLQEA